MQIFNNNRRAFRAGLFTSAAVVAVVSAFVSPSAHATQWYAAYFDTATINTTNYDLTENGVTYYPQDQGTFNAPQLFTQGAYKGTSLLISLPETPDNTAPDGSISDRFEYIWVKESDANAPAFNNVSRFLGFAYQFMSGSAPPTYQGTVFAQFWQGGSSTAKYSPPIYLFIVPSTNGSWTGQLCLKNDDTGQYFDDPPIVVWQGTLTVGVWQKYVLEVRPGWSGNGYVAFWINGTKVAQFSGKVGYKPASAGGLAYTLDTMRVKTGLYRHRGNPAILAGWDNIKYASTYSDAAP